MRIDFFFVSFFLFLEKTGLKTFFFFFDSMEPRATPRKYAVRVFFCGARYSKEAVSWITVLVTRLLL
jgi:hypothetical protein